MPTMAQYPENQQDFGQFVRVSEISCQHMPTMEQRIESTNKKF
jgi:hypothetical protein